MHKCVQDDRDQQPYRLRFVSDGTLSDEFFFVAQVRPLERTPRVVHTLPRMRKCTHAHMHMPVRMRSSSALPSARCSCVSAACGRS